MVIFVAMIFDALDGAVARMTRQTSAFGAQLDSMADMVTFGVAPAFLAKVLIDLHPAETDMPPKIVYVAAVVYVLCATMRLARFNVEIPSADAADHQEFAGLPSPAAAAVIAATLLFFCAVAAPEAERSALIQWMAENGAKAWLIKALPVGLVMCGLLMVSRFPYPHVAVTLLRGGHSFPFLATLVVLVLLIALEHEFGLLALIGLYVVIGILLGLFRMITTGRLGPPIGDDGDDEEE